MHLNEIFWYINSQFLFASFYPLFFFQPSTPVVFPSFVDVIMTLLFLTLNRRLGPVVEKKYLWNQCPLHQLCSFVSYRIGSYNEHMMTSSNGNTFCVTGHVCGEFTGPPVNSPHKGQWRGALMFSLICTWINGWVNNREAGDLRHYRVHNDVIVMNTMAITIPYHTILLISCYVISIIKNREKYFQVRRASSVNLGLTG